MRKGKKSKSQLTHPSQHSIVGPPAPKNLKQQLGLPEHWNIHHTDIYKDMVRAGPVAAFDTLIKYQRMKNHGAADPPPEIIDMIIEVARHYLVQKCGMKNIDAQIKKVLSSKKP